MVCGLTAPNGIFKMAAVTAMMAFKSKLSWKRMFVARTILYVSVIVSVVSETKDKRRDPRHGARQLAAQVLSNQMSYIRSSRRLLIGIFEEKGNCVPNVNESNGVEQ